MNNTQPKVSLAEIAKNLEDYDFKCNSVMVTASVEVFKKETNKLVFTTEMNSMQHNGTMNPVYADKFFEDINSQIKPMLIRHLQKNITTAPEKENKDGKAQG